MNWVVGCLLLFLAVFARLHRLPAADGPARVLGHPDRHGAAARACRSATRSARCSCPDDVGGPLSLLRFYALHVRDRPAGHVVADDAALLRHPPAEGACCPTYERLRHELAALLPAGRSGRCCSASPCCCSSRRSCPRRSRRPRTRRTPPNPAKSAWFLLWIQELVSYGTLAIYAAVALAALLVALPWLPVPARSSTRAGSPASTGRSRWPCSRRRRLVLALTVVGLFLRGPDWRLVLPF